MRHSRTELTEHEKETVINDSMRFIKYTAYRLSHRLPPQLTVQDLISAGVVGLLDALQRYTTGRANLSTFVAYRIKGAMLDELRSCDWLPRSLKEKIGRIRKAHHQLANDLGRLPDEEEVAESLHITLDEYYQTLQSASNAVVLSIEDLGGHAQEDDDRDAMECIPDMSMKTPLEQLEENNVRETLAQFIDRLPEKEKLVLSLYYREELCLKEIGKVMSLSEGRVCQILNQALVRLKVMMTSPVLQ